MSLLFECGDRMTKFIYFGRLEKEKWVDLIIDVFTKLYETWEIDWHIDIYGTGALEKECETLTDKFGTNVRLHGWASQETIQQALTTMDYCLMPSRVIETFGKSALESLRQWVPVIGFKKWGLASFVLDELNISSQAWDNDAEKLFALLQEVLHDKKEYDLTSLELEQYSPEKRLESLRSIIGSGKRILIISDFIKKIGGIETYIREVKELLEQNGYTVDVWWGKGENSFWWLFKTAFNLVAALRLKKKIWQFQPDIIWAHSVSRNLGRLPLSVIPQTTPLLMMFHDMGYFFPYPSLLDDTAKIPGSLDATQRNKDQWFLKKTLIRCKLFSLRLIRKALQKHKTTYLVPSLFMKPFVENNRQWKWQKTYVLPHFVKQK